VIYGAAAGDYLGVGTDGGDVNGDGFSDLLLGAYGVDDSSADVGAVYLFEGPVSGTTDASYADFTLIGDTASSGLGERVMLADISGDGQLDILAPGEGSDELLIFLGGGL
jgi:hypothetical protein